MSSPPFWEEILPKTHPKPPNPKQTKNNPKTQFLPVYLRGEISECKCVTKAIFSHILLRHAYKAGDRHITAFHAQRQSDYGCRSLFRFMMCITLFCAGLKYHVIILALVTCCHAIHSSCQLWNYLVWPK